MLPAEARGVLAARRCSWPASKQANRCARDITTSGIALAPDSTPAGSARTAAADAGALGWPAACDLVDDYVAVTVSDLKPEPRRVAARKMVRAHGVLDLSDILMSEQICEHLTLLQVH